ncbi:MAG: DUF4336 domain-containing protein [Gammaproteobacteria bacterium]|nr:DUF4336 domain-containing protein [Gammaproteobacteria bacterium]
MKLLKPLAEDLWLYEPGCVDFYSMVYSTRMTVLRLANGRLWIHSPERILPGLSDELLSLGEPRYLISPNKLHHLFLNDWCGQWPNATTYAAPGLRQKRKDIEFYAELDDQAEPEWAGEIDQLIFKGSWAMQELVFFHRASASLILTDLIENFSPDHFKAWRKPIAQWAGIVSPYGKTPIDWRLSFIGRKSMARQCLQQIMEWPFERIILSHGECILENPKAFLEQSFSWLR